MTSKTLFAAIMAAGVTAVVEDMPQAMIDDAKDLIKEVEKDRFPVRGYVDVLYRMAGRPEVLVVALALFLKAGANQEALEKAAEIFRITNKYQTSSN